MLGKKLDFISRQLGQLRIIKNVPETILAVELVNRAMDVLSAALIFLAVHIRRESRYFGIIGDHSPESN